MKFLARYREQNGGGLMLLRRFCGIWFKYKPFENDLNAVEAEMNNLVECFEAKFDQHRELMKKANQIRKEIESARESEKSYGTPFIASLPLFPFRRRATSKPPEHWRKFARVVEGRKGTLAEQALGTMDMNVVSMSGSVQSYDPREGKSADIVETEIIGSRAVPVVPRRNNQQKNRNNGGNNQQKN